MYPGPNTEARTGYAQNTQDTYRIQYSEGYTQDTLGYIRIQFKGPPPHVQGTPRTRAWGAPGVAEAASATVPSPLALD